MSWLLDRAQKAEAAAAFSTLHIRKLREQRIVLVKALESIKSKCNEPPHPDKVGDIWEIAQKAIASLRDTE